MLVFVYVIILNGKYMNGSLFSAPMHMNGVGFEMSGRTSIPEDQVYHRGLSLT